MKRFLVIGLGHFGLWAARTLKSLGHEVVAIDQDGDVVDRNSDAYTRGVVGDATDPRLLDEVGAEKVEAVVISLGGDLAASVLATVALTEMGQEDIHVKVNSPAAARALEALRVRATVFPERESAFRLAHHIVSRAVFDYIPLAEGYSIQEIAIPDAWIGKSLRSLSLPSRHGLQVVAVYDVLGEELKVVPDPDERLKESDVAIVAGKDSVVKELLEEKSSG